MKLSPKACRFVVEATRELNGVGSRDRLLAWLDRSCTEDVPPSIAPLAISALEQLEYWLHQRLKAEDVDEDRRADIMNDIAFIHSVQTDLHAVAAPASGSATV